MLAVERRIKQQPWILYLDLQDILRVQWKRRRGDRQEARPEGVGVGADTWSGMATTSLRHFAGVTPQFSETTGTAEAEVSHLPRDRERIGGPVGQRLAARWRRIGALAGSSCMIGEVSEASELQRS